MKRGVVISLHFGYWVLYFLLLSLILVCLQLGSPIKGQPFFYQWRFHVFFSTFAILPALLGFYSFYFLLFDLFLMRRKIVLLFVVGLLTATGCGLISEVIMSVLHTFKVGPGVFHEGARTTLSLLVVVTIIAVLNGAVALIMRGFMRWYAEIKLKEELMQKNFEMELALVKSQISPHFLFNTLNNIDVLIAKNAQQASAYLNQLSEIMRFMLYETKSEEIPLSRELSYLEKYIALQKIRTSNSDFARFRVEGTVGQATIAPMVLIPFVENAFKHADARKQGNVIDVSVEVSPKAILFECANKRRLQPSTTEYGGLGNELIKRRLSLLYPNRHQLEIVNSEEDYWVRLRISRHEA